MATQNSITVGVNVTDNGTTKQVHKSVKDLHNELKSTQQTAKSLGGAVAGTSTGGTAGSRRALQAAYGGTQGMTGQEYGQARGSAGATGASARDFANQAQGLGGLVRLYATMAANIFAASAAFNALSSAMDTSNMIRGLDQLGAASGVALGSLSKRLSDVTDGAISTREAMESVAKASSSGMSSDQILRMGKVAKQASQALGINLSDAVSRLTRGITKLEPELLDELGIFTKTGKAAEDYAKSIGKSVTELTTFERQQAYANAVLAEGERKFSAIDFETNPYTKLLATLKDVAFVGLNLVNNVFAPIAKFLSESPGALGAVIAGLGVTLVKQALPALGHFRESLKATSAQALEAAKEFKESFGDEFQSRLESAYKIPELEQNVRKAKAQLDGLKFAGKKPASLAALEQGDLSALSKVQKLLDTRNKTIETGMAGSKRASDARIAELKKEAVYIQAVIDLQKGYAQVQQVADKPQGRFDSEVIATKQYIRLREAADRSAAISNAAQNAQIVGITGSWKLLNKEIEEKGIKGIQKYSTLASGGLVAVGSRITQIVGAFGQVGMVIGLAASAFMFLDSLLTKNGKQMLEFSKNTDLATASTENLSRTVAAIEKRPFGEQLSTESLKALANALNETTSSLTNLIDATLEADKAANAWDRFIDGWLSIVNMDLRSKTGKALVDNVLGSLNLISDSEEARKAKATIAGILEIDPDASTKVWREAFENIADNKTKLKELEKEMKAVSKASQEAAFNAERFDTALKTAKDAYKQFTSAYRIKDDFTALGFAIIDTAITIEDAFKKPEDALARLAEVVKDTDKFVLFGPEDRSNLILYGDEITKVNASLQEQLQKVKDAREELLKIQQPEETGIALNLLSPVLTKYYEAYQEYTREAKINAAKDNLQKQEAAVNKQKKEAQDLISKFPNIAANQLKQGAAILSQSIEASLAAGSSKLKESVLGVLDSFNIKGVAEARGSLEESRLAQEGQILKLRFEYLRLQKDLLLEERINVEKRKQEQARQELREDIKSKTVTLEGIAETKRRISDSETEIARLNKLRGAYVEAGKDPAGTAKKISKGMLDGIAKDSQDARDVLQFALDKTGLIVQLRQNADAQSAAAFNKRIENLKEEEKIGKAAVDSEISRVDLELKKLDLKEKQNGFLDEAQLLSRLSYQNTIAELNVEKEQIATRSQLAQLDLAWSQGILKLDEASYLAARERLLTNLENNRITNLQIGGANRSLETEKAIVASTNKQLERKRELLELEKELADVKESYALEADKLQLEYDTTSGKVSERELQQRDAAIKLRDIEKDMVSKLLQAETSKENKLKSLLERKITLTEDEYKQQKTLIEDTYKAEVAGIDNVIGKRKELIEQELYKTSFAGQLQTTLQDAIATAIFEGGKAGQTKLKDFLKNSFRKFVVDMYINPIVGNFTGQLQGILGVGTATSAAGAAGSSNVFSIGSGAVKGLESFGNFLYNAGEGAFGSEFLASVGSDIQGFTYDYGSTIAEWGDALGTSLSYLNALNLALEGDYGAGIGAVIGTFLTAGNPIGGMIGAELGKMLGWTDTSGTYHSGGVGAYSAAGGRMEGQPANLAIGFGIGQSEMRAEANRGSAELAKATAIMLDSFATAFGKEAGYFVGTGFADDTSADGAWGALLIKRGEQIITDWGRGVDKWPGREFANAQEGVKQYEAAYVQEVRNVLLETAPDWADAILKELGDAPTLEQLSGAVSEIGKINAAFVNLGQTLPNFANLTEDAKSALLRMAGGIEGILSASSAYYEAFYTEEEKVAKVSEQFNSVVTKLGVTVPKTRLEFRKLVEAQDLNTEAGRGLYAVLMTLAPAFLQITEGTDDSVTALAAAEENLRQVYENRKSELEDLIGTWERVSDSLTQFIKDLQQGAQSTLTPRQKFELAQREYNQAIAAIKDPATDPKERARLAEEFQGLSTTLLETGRVYLASSSGYTDLFNTVLTDSTQLAADATSLATGFKTELSALNTMAEQLGIIEKEATKSTDFLGAIDTYFRTKYGDDVTNAVYAAYLKYEGRSGFGSGATNIDIPGFQYWAGNNDNMGTFSPQIAEQVQGLYQQLAGRTGDAEGVKFWSNMIASGTPIDAVTKAFATQVVMNEDTPTQQARDIVTGSIQTLYQQLANRTGDTEGVNYWYNRLASGTSKEDIVKSFAAAAVANEPNPTQLARDIVAGLAPATIPGFAVGTNYVPEDMLAMVHQGERIIPAADNAEILQSISNRNETNRVLVEEIKNLRREVQQLREQQSAETGSLIQATYSAQAEGATQVSNAITQSIDKQTQTTRIKQATKLN